MYSRYTVQYSMFTGTRLMGLKPAIGYGTGYGAIFDKCYAFIKDRQRQRPRKFTKKY